MQRRNSARLERATRIVARALVGSARRITHIARSRRAGAVAIGIAATIVMAPASGFAGERTLDDLNAAAAACAAGQLVDGAGNPCPDDRPIQLVVQQAKWDAAVAYHRFLQGNGSAAEVERAESVLSTLSRERIGANDWSAPDNTPARRKLAGEAVPYGYGALQQKFYPFEQITWWYCGPATAQSILWYLGPHRSESYDEVWGGRPWLTGDPYEDQWLLANNFWLATNKYHGTNWGYPYMPQTLNAWRGTFWYVDSATPRLGGNLTKENAFIAMQYDFDREYPVAQNVLYSSSTYYPMGFWPGITYMHWDVAYGFVYDEKGAPYVKIGQVYHDEQLPYERFQQVAWDTHWSAIGNWHGIVW